MKNIITALLTAILLVTSNVYADIDCKKDFVGNDYCAPFGGSVLETTNGITCAVGKCLVNNTGQFQCSDVAGGSVIKDITEEVKCVGNCISPSTDYCITFDKKEIK